MRTSNTSKLHRWFLSIFVCGTCAYSDALHAQPKTAPTALPTEHTGPRFIDSTNMLIFPHWSAGIGVQTISSSKGVGFEVMTPSFLYGRGAFRFGYSRHQVQGLNEDAFASNPNSGFEYLTYQSYSLQLLVPFGSGVESINPYLGGGINIIRPESSLSGDSSNVNFGLLGGLNIRFHSPGSSNTRWSIFGEFGYNTENVTADKIILDPQVADGMLIRGGLRYFL